jgi:hypothetical protein
LRGDLSIDTVYGFRKVNIGTFMVVESPLSVEENSDVNVRGVTYEGSDGLWEFLTKTNIDRSLVTPHDIRSYKRVLHSMSGHLSEIKRSGLTKTIRYSMYRDVIQKYSLWRARGGVMNRNSCKVDDLKAINMVY